MQEIESWLALGLVDGLGGESMRRLLRAFSTPAEIFSANITALERVVKRKVAYNIVQGVDQKRIAATLKWLEEPGEFDYYTGRSRLSVAATEHTGSSPASLFQGKA